MPKFWNSRKASRDRSPSSESTDVDRAVKPLSPQDSAKDFSETMAEPQAYSLPGPFERVRSSRRKRAQERPPTPPPPASSDVVIVGAGPAGLMLVSNLIRFGVNAEIIDDRSSKTATGRADGLQPKTIETLKQMRLDHLIVTKGVRCRDLRLWKSSTDAPLMRVHREAMFPSLALDCLDPYLLLAHQGFVEDLFLKDIMERGVDVKRNLTFVDYKSVPGPENAIEVVCKSNTSHAGSTMTTSYLVGCDGAQSNVRKAMGARPVGSSYDEIWGVVDGELDTDFPDLYSKVVIHSEEAGSVIISPRERGMTRLYVNLTQEMRDGTSREDLTQEFVMKIAEEIFEPYYLRWRHVEWFGRYQIGQKIASKFQDENDKVFIVGDACHTQSPNASQGMNHSMHDSWNLAWKLNLAVRGLAKPSLLKTYEAERRQVAEDLIDFDYEHSSAFSSGDPKALAENFQRSARFTSGFGSDYAPSVLNVPQKGSMLGSLRAGSLPPPAKVTRYFDSNPVDIQLDIPMLGQFRLYFFAKDIEHTRDFLEVLSTHALSYTSILGKITCAANASYTLQPPLAASSDDFSRPERYTTVSGIFSFAIVLQQKAREFEIESLPQLWRESKFTVYLDDVPHLDTRYMTCTDKWLGGVSGSEVGIVVMRPDGYIGTTGRFVGRSKENGVKAAKWLDEYFDAFLSSGF